jgi:Na+-driven multidrug efflux pump
MICYLLTQAFYVSLFATFGKDTLVARGWSSNVFLFLGAWFWALAEWLRLVSSNSYRLRSDAGIRGALLKATLFLTPNTVIGILALVAMYLTPPGLLSNGEMNALIVFLWWGVLTEPTRGFNVIISASLRGMNDTAVPSLLGILIMVMVGIPAAYYLGIILDLKANGVLGALLLEQTVRNLIMYYRWISLTKRWCTADGNGNSAVAFQRPRQGFLQ